MGQALSYNQIKSATYANEPKPSKSVIPPWREQTQDYYKLDRFRASIKMFRIMKRSSLQKQVNLQQKIVAQINQLCH